MAQALLPVRRRSSRNSSDLGSRTTSHPTHEKIDAIYLSPDAFARRTDEASIADQMGDVFAAAASRAPSPPTTIASAAGC